MAAEAHEPAVLEEAQSVARDAHRMLSSARQQMAALEKATTSPLEQVRSRWAERPEVLKHRCGLEDTRAVAVGS